MKFSSDFINVYSVRSCLYYFQHSFVIKKSVFYITFNLNMHQNIHGGKYNLVGEGGGIFQNATFDIENFLLTQNLTLI